jgi:hypothetical protein
LPKPVLEWLGAVGSVTTIVAFLLYLRERFTRRSHDEFMLGFLHGIKPVVEAAAQPNATVHSLMQSVIPQINDTMSRLK